LHSTAAFFMLKQGVVGSTRSDYTAIFGFSLSNWVNH